MKKLFFSILSFTAFLSFSQNLKLADSLERLLQVEKRDTAKVNLLLSIAKVYQSSLPEQSLKKAITALQISHTIQWERGEIESLTRIGIALLGTNRPDAAIDSLNKVLLMSQKSDYKQGEAYALLGIGTAYLTKSQYSLAMENAQAAKNLSEDIGNKKNASTSCTIIAKIYEEQGDNEKAIEYGIIALKIAEQLKEEDLIYPPLNNLAIVQFNLKNYEKAKAYYTRAMEIVFRKKDKKTTGVILNNLGNIFFIQQELDSAVSYYKKSIAIAREIGDKYGLASRLTNLGSVLYKKGDYRNAISFIRQGLTIKIEIDDKRGIAISYNNLGDCYLKTKEYDKSLEATKEALVTAKLISSANETANSYFNFWELYQSKGDYKNAFLYKSLESQLRDSLSKSENKKRIIEMEVKYGTERKEQENKTLQQKNKIQELELSRSKYFTYGFGGLSLFILLTAFLFFRQNKLQNQQRSLQLEQKLLRSQMNPHFIFNSLAAIESFIYENQPKEAGRYLSDFGRLMRLILENSAEEYVPLQKEIKTLEYYLALQKLRLEEKFTYVIHVDENINVEEVQIPPMLTQPFIENAIEHGLMGNKQEGLLEISFHVREDQLVVEVKDNGVGISKSLQLKEPKNKHKSMAIQITKERLKILNRFKKQKLGFLISDISDITKNSTGTKVEFSIPL